MKSFKSYIFALMAAASLTLPACQDDVNAPAEVVPVASKQANMTIAELKEMFWQDDANYAVKIVDTTDTSKRFIVAGRVISSDRDGNIFKSIVIQDATGALAFSVDAYNLYLKYRVGQEIVVDLTGMEIGKYAGLQQIGRKEWYEGYKTWQVSFMSQQAFEDHIELNGLPEAAKIDTLEVENFGQLGATPEDLRKYQSQLVRLKEVHFQTPGEPIAVYHANTNATMVDAAGATLTLRTSGYATFFNTPQPKDTVDIVGIMSYHSSGGWQLMLNDAAGIIHVGERPGSKKLPYTVEQGIAAVKAGSTPKGWVKGFIVGAVAPEVSSVSGNGDIEWTAPTVLGNNIVIAPTADVKSYDQCMVVSLPMGTALQLTANLESNASVIGKEIFVNGTMGTEYGMPAMKPASGNEADFNIPGVPVIKPAEQPVTPGSGVTVAASALTVPGTTEVAPYSITISKAGGVTEPMFHATSGAVRVYNTGTVTISGNGTALKSIKFILSGDQKYNYGPIKCSTGAWTQAQAAGDTELTWTGDATEVTFTVDVNATLSDTPTSKAQFRFTQIDINGGGNGSTGGGSTGGETPNPNPGGGENPGGPAGTGLNVKATQLNVAGDVTIDGYTFTIAKNAGTTAPALHAGTSAIRLYGANTITVSSANGNIKKLTFILSSDAHFRYGAVGVSSGKFEPAQAKGDTQLTWVGDATSVTFTVDGGAIYGDDGEAAKSQLRFTEINVNDTAAGVKAKRIARRR